ncbi:MAG: transposase [bacterium]
MVKYSFKFKKKIVKEYLNDEGGYRYFCKKYSLLNNNIIKKWFKVYNTFGNNVLIRKINKQKYTFDNY